MPVTENSSLLFSPCHLELVILENNMRYLENIRFFANKLQMTTEILPVIFKIVNIRRSGQGLWKFLIFCNSPVFFRIFLIIKINTFLLVFESEIGKFHENSFDKRQYFFHFRALLDTPIPGGVKQLMMPIMFTNF